MHFDITAYRKHLLQAVGLLLLGFFGFSVADLCSKLLQAHYSIFQVLAVSGMIGTIVSATWIITRHGMRAFLPDRIHLHLLRGVVTCCTAYCMVAALKTLPMADFYGIVFLSPFMLLIMTVIFLKEHVGWRRWAAVVVAFSGVVVLAGPQFDTFGRGFVFALGGAMFSAASVILLRKIGFGQPLPVYSFFASACIAIVSIICTIAFDVYLPFRAEDMTLFAFHGPMAMMGIICTSLGYARSPETSVVAPFMYTQIIWGIIFGWLFFGVMPAATTYAGLALVIGAGCYSIWRDYKRAHDRHKIIPDIT